MRHLHAAVARALLVVCLLVLQAACSTPSRPPPTAADAVDIDRVAAYLNSIPTFQARFIQSGSFGPDAGVVQVDRPGGCLRVDYAAPDTRVMEIAGGQVQIVDRSNGAITTMPVSRTPLGLLLTPRVTLSGAVTVAQLVHVPGTIQITLEKTGDPGQGSLSLVLSDQPLRLRAVTVIDRERQTLTMNLFDLDTAK